MGEQSGQPIPVEPRIDAAAFSSVRGLHEYCTQATDAEIRAIIASGNTFLDGDGTKFSHQSYAKTVMQCINDVLGL